MRELLAWHYMESIEHGDMVAAWLLEFGGWMPDPQLYGDATPLTRPDLYTPLDIERAIAEAADLFDLIEGTINNTNNTNGSASGAREEAGQPREGQTLPSCQEEGHTSDAESNCAISGASGAAPNL